MNNNAVNKLTKVLSDNHQSTTSSRRIIFEKLATNSPLSILQLTKLCQNQVDRATIYRTVSLFEKLGIINRIQLGWKYKIELSDLFSDHHHHLICSNCQKILPIVNSGSLEKAINQICSQLNFEATSHSFEINGLCQKCSDTINSNN